MTHLNIQQGLNIEVVSTNLIKKLYEAALSIPEPLEGELDTAYMSGNLLVDKSYRALVSYLTGRFPDLHINVTDNYYITFEDSAVLNVLLANNIGSDGIGVTEAEAANATFTAGFFENNTDITSFNTFNLFTKANTNPPTALFKGCTNLTSVNLSNITTISEREFYDCNNLNVSLNLSGLTSLGNGAFLGSGITSITNLGSITSIPRECFRWCRDLTSITLPSSVTSIGSYGFADCHITTMDLSHVTSIEGEAFVNSYLTTADLSNVTSIGNNAFKGSRLTGTLNLPNLVSLGQSSFEGTGITSITNLGSITSIPNSCFRSCPNLSKIILPTTVVQIGNNAFTDVFSTLYLKGMDNVISGGIVNKNITNPIYRSANLNAIFAVSQNGNASMHSYFLPNLTATSDGSTPFYNQPRYALFCDTCTVATSSSAISIGLLYFKNILTFGYATFKNCIITNLVINNITPPTYDITNKPSGVYTDFDTLLGNGTQSPIITTLWVPDSAVATYQANPLYSSLTIKGINTKTNGVDYDLPRYATYAAWETAEEAAVAQGGHAPKGLIEEYM